jgi:hypothetical protein
MAKTQGVNGLAVAASFAGALLVWSGIKGASVTSSLRSLLSGQQPSGQETATLSTATDLGQVLAGGGSASNSTSSGASAPAAGNNLGGNQLLGRMLAAAYGWGAGTEWNALLALWNRESGWNNRIWNGGSTAPTMPPGSSGAYGIPQALPYSKMPKAAWPPGYGGSASATAQISWGLGYIKSVYGSPSVAWAHETNAGWY